MSAPLIWGTGLGSSRHVVSTTRTISGPVPGIHLPASICRRDFRLDFTSDRFPDVMTSQPCRKCLVVLKRQSQPQRLTWTRRGEGRYVAPGGWAIRRVSLANTPQRRCWDLLHDGCRVGVFPTFQMARAAAPITAEAGAA